MTYQAEPPGLQEVADGKIDAFLCAEPVGQQAIDDGLPIRALDEAAFRLYLTGFVDQSSGYDPVAVSRPGERHHPSPFMRMGPFGRCRFTRSGATSRRPLASSISTRSVRSCHEADIGSVGRVGLGGRSRARPMVRIHVPGPWDRSLRIRLVTYFLLLSGVTVAVVGVVVYLRATQDLTTSEYERLTAVAEVKADSIDRWIDEQRRNVVFVGAIPGFGDDARDFLDPNTPIGARSVAQKTLDDVLGVVVRQTADAQEFLVLDLDGNVRLSTVGAHEGSSQATEPYYTNGSSHTYVQNAYTSTLTGAPTITISTPLFDANGKGRRVGVLAANLNLERIDRIVLETTGLGEGGATYLVGPNKRFLHARLDQGAFAAGVSSPAVDQALAGQNGQALYSDYAGVPVIGVYRWLQEHDAALIVELPQATAFAPAQSLALTIAVVGLLSALLLAFGMWLIARQVTRPILRLATTATAVAGGDLTATAPVTSEDEVGTLTRAFNDMTAQLRESVETLERRVEERTAELDDRPRGAAGRRASLSDSRGGAAARRCTSIVLGSDGSLALRQPADPDDVRVPGRGMAQGRVLRVDRLPRGPRAHHRQRRLHA